MSIESYPIVLKRGATTDPVRHEWKLFVGEKVVQTVFDINDPVRVFKKMISMMNGY